jgi:hypothetical protein
MKRIALALTLVVIALLAAPTIAMASSDIQNTGTGELRITPHGSYYPLPIMLSSPATFNITATDHSTGYSPIILLVMTNQSYQGLTGNVTVQWTGGSIGFRKVDFTSVSNNNAYVPPTGTTTGARYRVSGLKEHIGVNGTADQTLWYAYGRFLADPVTQTPQTFTITLPSTHPRMLVYALAKSSCTDRNQFSPCCEPLYDMRVPPTQPGFVVPEASAIVATSMSLAALVGYAVIKRRR